MNRALTRTLSRDAHVKRSLNQAEVSLPPALAASHSLRAVVAGIHLLLSLAVAAVAAIIVFLILYPPPYAAIAGGMSLFMLLTSVDVVLGPTLTAVAADPAKPAKVFHRDLAVIVALQIAAFAYGMHTIAIARPVYLSFEIDRLRVVTAADIDPAELAEARPEFCRLPWTGPKLIAAAKPTRPDEVLRSIDLALAGHDISMTPRNWRPYESQQVAAWNAARPLPVLLEKYPQSRAALEQIAVDAGQPATELRFLPLLSRQASWVALLAAPNARVVGYMPLEGFF